MTMPKARRVEYDITERLNLLDEQMKMAAAITRVLQSGYRTRDTSERCHRLELALFPEVLANLEAIWRLAGGELPPLEGEVGKGAEEKPDELPF